KLQTTALESGFDVVDSVTVHLAILVTGPEPGPVKLEKAKNQGAHILNLDQFENLIETGELPMAENKTSETSAVQISETKESSKNIGCLISLVLIIALLLFMVLTPWLA